MDQDGHRTDTRHPQHSEELPWAEVTQGQGCPHQLQHGDWGSCRTRELLGASCCCPQAARDEARGSCVGTGLRETPCEYTEHRAQVIHP